MYRLRDLFNSTINLVILLLIAVVTVLVVGGQTLVSSEDKTTVQASAEKEVGVFQSPLQPSPTPPTPIDVEKVKIEKVETVSPASFITDSWIWSPNGKNALVNKNVKGHLLHELSKEGQMLTQRWIGVYDLWILNLESNKEELITESATSWYWSPDGTSIAYIAPVAEEGMDGVLYIFNLSDKTPYQIAEVNLVQGFDQPIWLPTNEIIYIADAQIWIIQPDGKGMRQLNTLHLLEEGWSTYPGLAFYNGNISQFTISPDSKSIAYTMLSKTPGAEASEIATQQSVWVANLDGQNSQQLANNALNPSWSPDSEKLIYYANAAPSDSQSTALNLMVANLKTGEQYLVYKAPNSFSEPGNPVWSPGSDTVAFIEQPTNDLWFAKIDGSAQKQIPVAPEIGVQMLSSSMRWSSMVWSPDGTYLLVGQASNGPGVFYRLNLSTSN